MNQHFLRPPQWSRALVLVAGCLLVLLAATRTARAATPLRLCVFDPSGAAGDAFNWMKDYRIAALSWGVEVKLVPYTDEKTAAEDLKTGHCQAALLTGTRARAFNRFSGTLEAIGAIRSYKEMKTVLSLLANPKAGKRLETKEYATVAIFPVGGVFLHVANKSWDSVSKLAGKRIATLDFDQAALALVERIGAAVVPADVSTFAGLFNNHHVDAVYAPATAFKPLELEKGLNKGGGVVRLPLAQLTFQLVVRQDAKTPEAFHAQSRRYAAGQLETRLGFVAKAEAGIPNKYWIDLSPSAIAKNEGVFRQIRIQLRDKQVFDGTMLTLLRRIRCKSDATRAECAEKSE